jgi:hypothetical protein
MSGCNSIQSLEFVNTSIVQCLLILFAFRYLFVWMNWHLMYICVRFLCGKFLSRDLIGMFCSPSWFN